MNDNLYFERVAYLGVHQYPMIQARPCRPQGLSSNPGDPLEVDNGDRRRIVLDRSCSGSKRADLLSKPVLRSSNSGPPYLPPGRGVGCWSDDFEAAVDCSVFEYADVLG